MKNSHSLPTVIALLGPVSLAVLLGSAGCSRQVATSPVTGPSQISESDVPEARAPESQVSATEGTVSEAAPADGRTSRAGGSSNSPALPFDMTPPAADYTLLTLDLRPGGGRRSPAGFEAAILRISEANVASAGVRALIFVDDPPAGSADAENLEGVRRLAAATALEVGRWRTWDEPETVGIYVRLPNVKYPIAYRAAIGLVRRLVDACDANPHGRTLLVGRGGGSWVVEAAAAGIVGDLAEPEARAIELPLDLVLLLAEPEERPLAKILHHERLGLERISSAGRFPRPLAVEIIDAGKESPLPPLPMLSLTLEPVEGAKGGPRVAGAERMEEGLWRFAVESAGLRLTSVASGAGQPYWRARPSAQHLEAVRRLEPTGVTILEAFLSLSGAFDPAAITTLTREESP